MAETKVGKISHVYGKIGVGVVELTGKLSVGDTIKIKGHERDFEQVVTSMQIEMESVESASKGQSIGLKLDEKVKDGDLVYKV